MLINNMLKEIYIYVNFLNEINWVYFERKDRR